MFVSKEKGEEGGNTGGEGLEDAGSTALDVAEDLQHARILGGRSTVHPPSDLEAERLGREKRLGGVRDGRGEGATVGGDEKYKILCEN